MNHVRPRIHYVSILFQPFRKQIASPFSILLIQARRQPRTHVFNC